MIVLDFFQVLHELSHAICNIVIMVVEFHSVGWIKILLTFKFFSLLYRTRICRNICTFSHPLNNHINDRGIFSPSWYATLLSHTVVLDWESPKPHLQTRSNETVIWCIYEVKWVFFKLIFCNLKMLALPWPLLCSTPHVRAFKLGTVWHFTSRGIRTTRSLS